MVTAGNAAEKTDTLIGETADIGGTTAAGVISRVGHVTRMLLDDLRELGYSTLLEKAASAIPDARERLSYVAAMTEKAAERSLNATEIARPIQDELASQALALARSWSALLDGKTGSEVDQGSLQALIQDTRTYLESVPERTDATNAQLVEIMMAQDFQDLTGQVIKKLMATIYNVEQELLRLLLDHLPAQESEAADEGLVNGPVIKGEAGSDVVTNQSQVDDLLAKLGF
jgi:chemotaxis protein CheZ